MQVMLIDSDREELLKLQRTVLNADPRAQLIAFSDPLSAVQYGRSRPPDVLITSDDLSRLTGYDVIRLLRRSMKRGSRAAMLLHGSDPGPDSSPPDYIPCIGTPDLTEIICGTG